MVLWFETLAWGVCWVGLALVPLGASAASSCEALQRALDGVSDGRAKGACRCYTSALGSALGPSSTEPWVGCTRREVFPIHHALNALPADSALQRLWLWDSLVPVVPADLFDKARPRHLLIQSSRVGKFEDGALEPLGPDLTHLSLSNNIIRSVRSQLFANLSSLEELDLSRNQITRLNGSSFGNITSLTSLSVQRNRLSSLADGSFRGLPGLRSLNLAFNRLSTITRQTFAGLEELETLSLEGNGIKHIEEGAFDQLRRLKTLNLGGNRLSALSVQGLGDLSKLRLDNNTFKSLDGLRLSGLPKLEMLSLDENRLESVESLPALPSLVSLSLAGNEITSLGADVFARTPRLRVLSLQRNRLTGLPDGALGRLAELRDLFLGFNQLERVSGRTLAGLSELRVLSLSHNRIREVEAEALEGLGSLRRLHLAHNRLREVPERVMVRVGESVGALDLSDNPWECNCSSLWLSEALRGLGTSRVLAMEATRCEGGASGWARAQLVAKEKELWGDGDAALVVNAQVVLREECGLGWEGEGRSWWVTALGLTLGLLCLLTLSSLAAVYGAEARRQGSLLPSFRSFHLRRVPSDLQGLIPDEPSHPDPRALLLPPPPSVPPQPLAKHHPTGDGKSVRFTDT